MKKKKATIKEFSYLMVIINIWKNKNLILSFSVAGFLIAFILTLNLSTYKKAKITIKDPPKYLFNYYDNLIRLSMISFDRTLDDPYITVYKSNLLRNLESQDNLSSFLNKFNYINDEFIFNTENYYAKEKTKPNVFFGVYEDKTNGEEILTNYIKATQKKTTEELILTLEKDIKASINFYEAEISIAKKLGIIEPINLNYYNTYKDNKQYLNSSYQSLTTPPEIYYMGTIVLSLRLTELKNSLAKLDVKNFDYDIILDDSRYIENQNNYINEKRIAGFLIGFILSLLILYVKFFFLKFKHKLY